MRGSTAPVLTVPAVATTAIGTSPDSRSRTRLDPIWAAPGDLSPANPQGVHRELQRHHRSPSSIHAGKVNVRHRQSLRFLGGILRRAEFVLVRAAVNGQSYRRFKILAPDQIVSTDRSSQPRTPKTPAVDLRGRPLGREQEPAQARRAQSAIVCSRDAPSSGSTPRLWVALPRIFLHCRARNLLRWRDLALCQSCPRLRRGRGSS